MTTLRLSHFSAFLALAAFTLLLLGRAFAEDEPVNKAPGTQPVNVCVVSGEHLQPGEIVTYVYKASGHPERTVRFCCHKCLARFKADPERYLKKLDELEAEKTAPPHSNR